MSTIFNHRPAVDRSLVLEAQAKFHEAVALHNSGRLLEAKKLYEEILKSLPDYSDALHFLGIIAYQSNDHLRAIELIGEAIRICPHNAAYHYNRGNAFVRLEQFSAAVDSFGKAIELKPDYAKAFCNRGSALLALENAEAAAAAFAQAIALEPGYTEAYYNRGIALARLKDADGAIASYQLAVKLNPGHADAHLGLGNAFLERGKHGLAIESYERAIELKPREAAGYVNLGKALLASKQPAAAVASYQRAIQLKPDYAEAHYDLGVALAGLQQFDAALASYAHALAFRPDYPEALSNCGWVLLQQKRQNAAVASCESAIRFKPDFAEAHYNLGLALEELGQYDRAVASFERAIALKPDLDFALGDLLFARMRICDWQDAEADLARLTRLIEDDKRASSPFVVLARIDSPRLHKQSAQIWVNAKHPPCDDLGPIPKRGSRKKLRIGYYSADFHNHATAFLIADLLERHDRNAFEVIGFSFGPDVKDEMRLRLTAAFDQFVDIRALSDLEAAKLSRELEIDIAVDLKGLTQDSRCGVFAARSAPVQVNYLGYPATMGADYYDYVIADETVIPQECARHFVEKIVYLPDSYQPNDAKRKVSDIVYTRSDFGLPARGFVFCCFNNSFKITPRSFDSWMRLLKEIDQSVLWLLEDNPFASSNLRKEAERRGVDAARLVFAARLPLTEHLARHKLADLFIDTLPYNAHTTASDALWAGLPVLTCMGRSFPGRVAASLLKAVGLPELITQTQGEYERLATSLARNPEKLALLRQKLARNRLTSPLFDTARLARHIESAYLKMHEMHQVDAPREHLLVPVK